MEGHEGQVRPRVFTLLVWHPMDTRASKSYYQNPTRFHLVDQLTIVLKGNDSGHKCTSCAPAEVSVSLHQWSSQQLPEADGAHLVPSGRSVASFGSLKLSGVEVVTPWKLANCCKFPPKELVVTH